jgi:acyl carrier protein
MEGGKIGMALRDEIKNDLFLAVSKNLNVPIESLNESVELIKDLGAKSADLVRILSDIEDKYEFTLNFMKFKRKEKLGEEIDYIVEVYES